MIHARKAVEAPFPSPAACRMFQETSRSHRLATRAEISGNDVGRGAGGSLNRLNREGLSGEEQYLIDKVSKLTGDTWIFQTRLNMVSVRFRCRYR